MELAARDLDVCQVFAREADVNQTSVATSKLPP